jgi:hypothetical protein
MKKLITAGLAMAGLLISTSLASAQLCVFGIMIAAAIVGSNEKRELTTTEAATCGLVHEKVEPKKAVKTTTKKTTTKKTVVKKKTEG